MVNLLVKDIRKALEKELYFVALSAALTLPDICGKAEYPDEKKDGRRYRMWYDKYIGDYEKCSSNEKIPYPDGNLIYKLRCALLHAGNPSIEGFHEENKIDITHFILITQKSNEFDFYGDSYKIQEDESFCEYRMNVQRICTLICNVAEIYYKENQNKFHFDYNIMELNNDEVEYRLYDEISRLNQERKEG